MKLIAPKKPVAINFGRYATQLWEYNGNHYGYWQAAALYEKDRADWLAERSAES